MRIHLKLSETKETIPFNYQPVLTGALHKWLGPNDLHDQASLYSFSWINGGTALKKGIRLSEGGSMFISAYSDDIIKMIIDGIKNDPLIAYGIKVREIIIQPNPGFEMERVFHPASPILIKRNINGKVRHYTYEDPEANALLTETLKTKLAKAHLPFENMKVEFDMDYRNRKIKVIHYNNIGNKVNLSAVRIKGTPQQIEFAWNVGVGNSTGIGFGALK